jgi:hypothetical protein
MYSVIVGVAILRRPVRPRYRDIVVLVDIGTSHLPPLFLCELLAGLWRKSETCQSKQSI